MSAEKSLGRVRREWILFLLTRGVAILVDAAIMGFSYVAAYAVRFSFQDPRWGWHAVAFSFAVVWAIQFFALLILGGYTRAWRRFGALDMPRYLGAAFLSLGLLLLLRSLLGTDHFAFLRPPYSVAFANTFFAFTLCAAARLLWRFNCEARRNEKLLLGRAETVASSQEVLDFLRDKTVLVTGAGGSIGSEIVRQTARSGVKRVILVERGENALYEIDREMRQLAIHVPCIPELADIADEPRMRGIFEKYHPEVVLHAAAYKHVPMVEENPLEGLRNNAIATRLLGEMARDAAVARFVMISTDKAVNPVSVMGMTKRLAEELLLPLNGGKTAFSCVRFGNVLGSSGSVVPLFKSQIAQHGPLTVTHPDMRRYFMSVQEAVSLVLQAAAMREGGFIYTLDMGEPIRILDLAEDMIRQAGFRPYVDIPITFTGIRPGEKLFEELDVTGRDFYRTGHARIFVCHTTSRAIDFNALKQFAAQMPSDEAVRAYLTQK